jgi:hypothetical protein
MSFFSANSEDFYEYADGLVPQEDMRLAEDMTNLGILGESSDPLLALALSHINADASRFKIKEPDFPLEKTIEDPHFLRDLMITSDINLPLIQLE